MKLNAKARLVQSRDAQLLALQDLKTLGPRFVALLTDIFPSVHFEITHNGKAEVKGSESVTDGMLKIAARDINKDIMSKLGYKLRTSGATFVWEHSHEPTWVLQRSGGRIHLAEQ